MKKLSALVFLAAAACGAASTTAQRPAPASPWIGLTSFDLGVRLETGDHRWVEMMAREGFTVARIVVSSVHRTKRTLTDGLRQLPLTLSALGEAGLKAEVVVFADTREYGLTRDEMKEHLRAVVAIALKYPDSVAGIEIANESSHGGQVEALVDSGFLAEVEALVPQRFATSCGSTHGGEVPRASVCSYITHHGDRSKSPEENAAIMAVAQRSTGLPVVDDEALGIGEVDRPGARTNDPGYAERQARAARRHGLAGVTLHIDAGLTANVDDLGPVQREAMRGFVAAMRGS